MFRDHREEFVRAERFRHEVIAAGFHCTDSGLFKCGGGEGGEDGIVSLGGECFDLTRRLAAPGVAHVFPDSMGGAEATARLLREWSSFRKAPWQRNDLSFPE